MKTISTKILLDLLLANAKRDAFMGKTGWSEMGVLSCAYYPNSDRHSYFLPTGVISFAQAESWLRGSLRFMTVREAA